MSNAEPMKLGELLLWTDAPAPDKRLVLIEEMARRLRKVAERHRPWGIYDECGHEHTEDEIGKNGVIEVDEVGITCEEGLVQTVCYECATDDGEVREDTYEHEFPCPTRRDLDGEKDRAIWVNCAVCHLRKKPVGRAAPLEMANSLCDDECPGYRQAPPPDCRWPGEEECSPGCTR